MQHPLAQPQSAIYLTRRSPVSKSKEKEPTRAHATNIYAVNFNLMPFIAHCICAHISITRHND